jgi:hypothetical protein
MLGGGARFDKKRFKEDIEVFQVYISTRTCLFPPFPSVFVSSSVYGDIHKYVICATLLA